MERSALQSSRGGLVAGILNLKTADLEPPEADLPPFSDADVPARIEASGVQFIPTEDGFVPHEPERHPRQAASLYRTFQLPLAFILTPRASMKTGAAGSFGT